MYLYPHSNHNDALGLMMLVIVPPCFCCADCTMPTGWANSEKDGMLRRTLPAKALIKKGFS